ncbi:preprotein translocase subunit SecE [Kocuria sp.]|uniref:preprotein translocase subunit SecE n=1 Tax=Kocuria sp. TaxID=1871328 RepID=UPI0026DC5311|nr:preprotein translocase subunit SecE [Kocuria sp.]MDO4920171.1 preprotein translocase subunit SecE [Kocuria sp.]
MSHTVAGQTPGQPAETDRRRGILGRIWLFIRQVVGELKKVVTPSRRELVNYVLVVLVFVAFMMVLISLLDLGFGQLAIWLFGNGDQPQ